MWVRFCVFNIGDAFFMNSLTWGESKLVEIGALSF